MSFFDIYEGRFAAEADHVASPAPVLATRSLVERSISPPKPFFRMALMICGNFGKEFHERYGDYRTMYQHWLEKSLPPNSGAKFQLDGYEAREQQYPPDVDIYDAIFISGSPADAYADIPWINNLVAFIRDVYTNHRKIRIYGICFGHQIISRSLGATVQPNEGRWEIGLNHVVTTYMGKLLFGTEKMTLMLLHQDHVVLNSLTDLLGSGEIYLLGQTLRTPNQGFVKFYPDDDQPGADTHELVRRVHILTTQAHPEFTEAIVAEIVKGFQKDGKIPTGTDAEHFPTNGPNPNTNNPPGNREMRYFDGVFVIGRTFWRILGVDYGFDEPAKVPIIL